jgi:hypothetical protein
MEVRLTIIFSVMLVMIAYTVEKGLISLTAGLVQTLSLVDWVMTVLSSHLVTQ